MSFDLEQAIHDAVDGGVVSIPAGTYPSHLLIEKPISLIAMGTVVLDGQRQGSVLRIRTAGVVKLAGLMIVGGRTDHGGGGIALLGGSLELLQCTMRFNEAPAFGGGALYVRRAQARVNQCRIEGNTGRQGAGVLVDDGGRAEIHDCLIAQNAAFDGGGVRVMETGVAELVGCTLADNKVLGDAPTGGALSLSGTMSATPSLSVSHCVISERTKGPPLVWNFPTHPGTLSLTKNLLPDWCRELGGDNVFGPAGFVGTGTEPYCLAPGSPAIGKGDPALWGPQGRDVLGRPRVANGQAPDLGAFTFRP